MKTFTYGLVGFLMAMAGCGCTTTDGGDPGQTAVTQKAVELLGGRDKFVQFIVPSRGSILDGVVSGMSLAAPSALSRQLADVMREAKRRGLQVVISGPNEQKTRISFQNAIRLVSDGELVGVKILYFGPADDSGDLGSDVQRTGAEFRYVEKPIQ